MPVVVVKNKPIAAAGYKKIVLPFDLTMESRQKVDWAIHVGKTFNSEIHIVYTSSDDEYVKTATKASIRNVQQSLTDRPTLVTNKTYDRCATFRPRNSEQRNEIDG